METVMKGAALAVTGALLALTVKRHSGEFGALVSIAAALMIGVLTLELMRPVMTFAQSVRDKAGLSGGLFSPVIKTLAIGLVTEFGANLCEDAGEKAVASALRLCGGAAAFYALLPLLQSVLDLLDQIL